MKGFSRYCLQVSRKILHSASVALAQMKLRTSAKLTVKCWPSAAVISTGTDGEAACRAVLWAARCCMAAMRDAVPWTGAEAGADVVGADAPLRVNAI